MTQIGSQLTIDSPVSSAADHSLDTSIGFELLTQERYVVVSGDGSIYCIHAFPRC